LKKELDGSYVYTKKKIPVDARCDVCNEAPKNGQRAPQWFIVSNRDKLTVRCKRCKMRSNSKNYSVKAIVINQIVCIVNQ